MFQSFAVVLPPGSSSVTLRLAASWKVRNLGSVLESARLDLYFAPGPAVGSSPLVAAPPVFAGMAIPAAAGRDQWIGMGVNIACTRGLRTLVLALLDLGSSLYLAVCPIAITVT